MSEAKFTPGPWSIDEVSDGSVSGQDDGQKLPVLVARGGLVAKVYACANPLRAFNDPTLPDIGDVRGCEGWPIGRKIAYQNAALIAAAPDLYAACKALAEVSAAFQSGKRDGATMGMVSLAMDAARAALSKAEGVTVAPSRVAPGEPDPRD